MKFRIDAGDSVLEKHLCTAATYVSNTIQNQIVGVLSNQVCDHIVTNIKATKWFTVIADEVTDLSDTEQLSIVLRYVDIVPRSQLEKTSSGLLNVTTEFWVNRWLKKISQTLQNLEPRSVTSPLASLQLCKKHGGLNQWCSGSDLRRAPTCYLPSLHITLPQLAVVKSLRVTSVRNMMGVIGRTYQFFTAHPKPQASFGTIDKRLSANLLLFCLS